VSSQNSVPGWEWSPSPSPSWCRHSRRGRSSSRRSAPPLEPAEAMPSRGESKPLPRPTQVASSLRASASLPSVAETVNTNQFKNGMHIELEGGVWRIVEFQHVKPGKGGAFVRTKLKNLDSGAVVDKTFRAGEKFSRVHTETKNVQYLYDSGDDVVFMDEES